jgi:hypothetical protein
MSVHLAVVLEHVVPTLFVEHDLSAVRIRGRGEDRGRHRGIQAGSRRSGGVLAANFAKKSSPLTPASGSEPCLPLTGLGRGTRLGLGPSLGRYALGSLSLKVLGDRLDLSGERSQAN